METAVLLSDVFQLLFQQLRLPLQLCSFSPQTGVVACALHSFPQQVFLLSQQGDLLLCRVKLGLKTREDIQWNGKWPNQGSLKLIVLDWTQHKKNTGDFITESKCKNSGSFSLQKNLNLCWPAAVSVWHTFCCVLLIGHQLQRIPAGFELFQLRKKMIWKMKTGQ